MDILLLIISGIFIAIGIGGSLLPVLPGPILSYCGIVILHLTKFAHFSTSFLISYGVIAIVIILLDMWMPVGATKAFGASRFGTWGAGIGVVAGIFLLPPIGIVVLPFTGALAGELIGGKNFTKSLKGAMGSFLGFIVGVVMNLAVCLLLTFYYIEALFLYFR
jgi:uncharacterized protein